MKRHRKSVIAAAMAMLLLSVCGNETFEDNIESLSNISAASLGTHIENTEQYSENASVRTASAKQTEQTENNNILIAYFSRWGNTEYPDDVDATTSPRALLRTAANGTARPNMPQILLRKLLAATCTE